MIKLISATPSPWARKVRIILIEKGLPVEIVNDVPWSAETCVSEFNPLEKLPILIVDGDVIYESRLIVEWLERMFADPPLIPADDRTYLFAKKCEVLADGALDALLLYQLEKGRRQCNPDWLDRQRRKLVRGVAEVAKIVGNADFAVASRFTIADAAFASLLGALDFCVAEKRLIEYDWRALHDDLRIYFEKLGDRPAVRDTAPVMFDFDLQKQMAGAD